MACADPVPDHSDDLECQLSARPSYLSFNANAFQQTFKIFNLNSC